MQSSKTQNLHLLWIELLDQRLVVISCAFKLVTKEFHRVLPGWQHMFNHLFVTDLMTMGKIRRQCSLREGSKCVHICCEASCLSVGLFLQKVLVPRY